MNFIAAEKDVPLPRGMGGLQSTVLSKAGYKQLQIPRMQNLIQYLFHGG